MSRQAWWEYSGTPVWALEVNAIGAFGTGWFWFESRDGPRYIEALKAARTMRYVGFTRTDSRSYDSRAETWEREHGIPASWHRLG